MDEYRDMQFNNVRSPKQVSSPASATPTYKKITTQQPGLRHMYINRKNRLNLAKTGQKKQSVVISPPKGMASGIIENRTIASNFSNKYRQLFSNNKAQSFYLPKKSSSNLTKLISDQQVTSHNILEHMGFQEYLKLHPQAQQSNLNSTISPRTTMTQTQNADKSRE